MPEREPRREQLGPSKLFFLGHPGNEQFSGYGIAPYPNHPDYLVGLLMVDHPQPVSVDWLHQIGDIYGAYQLVPMTANGDTGIVCQMHVSPKSRPHLRQQPFEKATAVQAALEPLLAYRPRPVFNLDWDPSTQLWRSEMAPPNHLPSELQAVFERTGHGCAAVETPLGITHACYANDNDIAGFRDQPVDARWQVIKMPTAPLMRLEFLIFDQPANPYAFETFLNITDPEQLSILAQLAYQDNLYMQFYGQDLQHRQTRTVPHASPQRFQLEELVGAAITHLQTIPDEERDYDRAKSLFIQQT